MVACYKFNSATEDEPITKAHLNNIETRRKNKLEKMSEERSQDDRFSEESDIETDCEKDEKISDTKKYSCKHCRKPFSNPHSLKVHVSSVHKKVKHKCPHCGKQFSQKANLSTHISNVHDEIDHVCPTCEKIFSQRSSLCTHISNFHEKKDP